MISKVTITGVGGQELFASNGEDRIFLNVSGPVFTVSQGETTADITCSDEAAAKTLRKDVRRAIRSAKKGKGDVTITTS